MSLAHLTLASQRVEETAAFFQRTLGYARDPLPANVQGPTVWLNIGRGQQMHVLHAENFAVSAFEAEFGRHVAVYYPNSGFAALKSRIVEHGGVLIDPLRPTPFERFFFREPVNGYVFEVIEQPA